MKKSSKSKKEVSKKKISKKQIIIFSIIGVLLLSIIAGIIIYFKVKESDPLNVKNPYDYLVFDEENNAFFNKVSEAFEVKVIPKDKFSYKVVDSEGKEVDTVIEKKSKYSVIKPKEKYKQGEVYTLTIEEGTFENEDLKDVSKIEFKVVRKQVEKVIYNKNVKEVKSKEVKVTDNVIETKNKYQVGDIVLIDNKEVYKVTSINNDGTYQVSVPELKEVYKELDIYIDEQIKITEIIPAEEIEEYVAYNVSQSKWYQSIIKTVNAAPKIKVDLDTTGGKAKAKVEVEIPAGESGLSIPVIKKHNLKFKLELEIEVWAHTEINLVHHDVQITLKMKDTTGFEINFKEAKFDELTKKTIKDATRVLESAKLLNTLTTDNGDVVAPLGGTLLPIGTTGLFLEMDFGLLLDYKMAVDAGYENTNERTTTFGYKWNAPFDLTLIGKVNSNNKKGKTYIGGKAEFKLGAELNAGLNLLNLAEVKFVGNSGAYGEAELKIGVGELNNEPFYEMNSKGAIGLFLDGKIKAEVFKMAEAEWKFFEQKLPITSYKHNNTNKDEIVMKQEEDNKDEAVMKEENKTEDKKEDTTTKPETNNNSNNNTTTTPTYKYTADEVRQKLQEGYNIIAREEYMSDTNTWEFQAGTSICTIDFKETINTSSNMLSVTWNTCGYAYTCNYNYVNDTMSCINYENARNNVKNECQSYYDEIINDPEGLQAFYEEFGTVDNCVNVHPFNSKPTNYRGDINNILSKVGLSYSDLGVLK